MKTYIVFDIQGYDTFVPDKDLYIGITKVLVIAETEEEALQKAKIYHPTKANFRCLGSIEYAKQN